MPRRRRTLLFPLDADGSVFLRARLDTDGPRVAGFVIQLEAALGAGRVPIIRYDTAHGYVHEHVFQPDGGEVRRRLRFGSWEEAYTYCYEYLKLHWRPAIGRFEGST